MVGASLVAQTVKNLSAMWETRVQSTGWEDSPVGGHSNSLQYSCLENLHGFLGRPQSMRLQRIGHNVVTNTFTSAFGSHGRQHATVFASNSKMSLMTGHAPVARFW